MNIVRHIIEGRDVVTYGSKSPTGGGTEEIDSIIYIIIYEEGRNRKSSPGFIHHRPQQEKMFTKRVSAGSSIM